MMLVLLPPSETKRSGGEGSPIRLEELWAPQLEDLREQVITALEELSHQQDLAQRTLKLSDRQLGDLLANQQIRTAPTMPAIDRYTGVLFDALQAASLNEQQRAWLGEHVCIHAALFGPVSALDMIPSYRLAAGHALPGLGSSLKALWSDRVGEQILRARPSFVLDLRSAAYIQLGAIPSGVECIAPRFVVAGEDGTVRALNHFNKKGKGQLLRRLAEESIALDSVASFLSWAKESDIQMVQNQQGWDIFVPE